MLNAKDIEALLANATSDTIVHLEYRAGSPAKERAKAAVDQASDWNKAPTEYVGHFAGMRRNRFGELVLTLWVHNRGQTGACRSFNPSLGEVRAIRVVHPD